MAREMRPPDKWEIRKSGKAVVSSPVKNCGYSDGTLRQLRRAGYRLYLNGKAVK